MSTQLPGLDFSSPQQYNSASVVNPTQPTNYALSAAVNGAAGLIGQPGSLWSGTPIRNFLGVTPAYASSGSAGAPNYSPVPQQTSSPTNTSTPTNSGSISGDLQARAAGYSSYQDYLNKNPQAVTNTNQNQQNALNQQIRNEIGSGFDSYITGLQNQYNNLTPEYNDMQSQINNDYSGQYNTLNTQNQQAVNGLNASQTQAQLNQSKNLRDLAQQYSTQLQNGYNALGAMGAGDSSANQMFGFASQQAARRAQGDLMGQYAGVQNQINMNRSNLQNTFNSQINQLENWKNTQLTGLSQWLTDNKNKFQSAIGMSQQQKQQALAALDQTALQRLQQLDDQATQFRQGIVNGAMNMQSALAQAEAYMAAYGKQIPSNFSASLNLNSLPQFAPNAGNAAAYNVAGYNPWYNQNQNQPAGGTAGLYYDQNGNPIQ